ncbi:hypothetical protein LCGC14_2808380 [marine sediment metagenome]|uniref:Terminase small subunit n=1 Tax=marine sediment metagenome TaxID=412755 RepID=A0A0F9AU48_9ZZZZ
MPSIKDESTVKAIAREFVSNGRNKTEALRTIGYKDSYCDTNGIGVVYSNIRVIEAIAVLDVENGAKLEITRELVVKEAWAIVADPTSTKTEITRALALVSDVQGFKREAAPNKEKEAALAARMTDEDRELAGIAALVRTEQEARRGLKLAEVG